MCLLASQPSRKIIRPELRAMPHLFAYKATGSTAPLLL